MSADRRTRQRRDRAKASKSLVALAIPAAVIGLLAYFTLGDESIGPHIRNIVDPLVRPILRFIDNLLSS